MHHLLSGSTRPLRVRSSASALVTAAVLAAGIACGTSAGPSDVVPGEGGGPVGSIIAGSSIQFVSGHNGSTNPAVDTIPVGTTVTWTWRGDLPHSVRSTSQPAFTGSGIRTGSGTHAVLFNVPGTYRYECGVHGPEMTGRILVQ